jgi:hypothetical protein
MVRSKASEGECQLFTLLLSLPGPALFGRSGVTPSAFTSRITPASVDDEDHPGKSGLVRDVDQPWPKRRHGWLADSLRGEAAKAIVSTPHPAIVVFLHHLIKRKDKGSTCTDNRRLILSTKLLPPSQAYAPISARQTVPNLQTLLCRIAHLKKHPVSPGEANQSVDWIPKFPRTDSG